jgi:hypothetical protein
MTNLNLHKSLPVTVSDRVGEILSAIVLVLSGVLALVTLATV